MNSSCTLEIRWSPLAKQWVVDVSTIAADGIHTRRWTHPVEAAVAMSPALARRLVKVIDQVLVEAGREDGDLPGLESLF